MVVMPLNLSIDERWIYGKQEHESNLGKPKLR